MSGAVGHLEPNMPVKITQTTNMVTLVWQTNGTTGAVIEDGRAIRPD
jgi:hypothetical protein